MIGRTHEDEAAATLRRDPFLAGRTEAAERYGHLAKNAAQWRRISLALLVACVACVSSVIYMAGRITVVPYIVQVDQHGYQIAVEPVAPSKVDARLIIAHIGRYVWSMKTVFKDPAAQMHLMNFVYNTTPPNTPASRKYQGYYNEQNPLERSDWGTVGVTVNSVLSLSEGTWQCEWTEDAYSGGERATQKHYRGIFTTTVIPPKSMQEILLNPLGIYITDFDFSEVVSGANGGKER